jgi:hypothetical protein
MDANEPVGVGASRWVPGDGVDSSAPLASVAGVRIGSRDARHEEAAVRARRSRRRNGEIEHVR